jgi:hypothetical protein
MTADEKEKLSWLLVGTDHVIYTLLAQAFQLPDPIFCMFVVGSMTLVTRSQFLYRIENNVI